MLKYFYKTILVASFGILAFQNSFAVCSINTGLSIVTNSPICSGNSAIITIKNAESGVTYQAFENNVSISTSTIGAGSDLSFQIVGLSNGNHTVTIKATSTTCGSGELANKAIVKVNQAPQVNQTVIGSTVCPGVPTATIRIYGSMPGEEYQAYLGTTAIGAPVTSVTDTVLLTIPTSGLQTGVNQIVIKATIAGCGSVILTNKANVIINALPSFSFSVTGDVICANNPNAKITINGSSSTIQFQLFIGASPLLSPFYGDAGTNTTVKLIPTSLLTIGQNLITVKATISSICQTLNLSENTTITVNPLPTSQNPILIGDTVTMPVNSATITVMNPELGIPYQASQTSNLLGSPVTSSSNNPLKLSIPVGPPNGLDVGVNDVTISFTISGCETKTFSATTVVVVKPEVITSIEDKSSTSNFAVWPNPFTSEIHITSEKLKGQLKLQILDATGNIVHQESFSNTQDLKISSDLKSGIYFLQLESDGIRENIKLIKN